MIIMTSFKESVSLGRVSQGRMFFLIATCFCIASTSASSLRARKLSNVTDIGGVLETESRKDPNAQVSEEDLGKHVITPRIVGGSRVAHGAYSYFVSVDKNYFPACGGSLVAPDVVLTAAHCQATKKNCQFL